MAVTEEGVQSFPRTHDRRTHDSVGVRFGFLGGLLQFNPFRSQSGNNNDMTTSPLGHR